MWQSNCCLGQGGGRVLGGGGCWASCPAISVLLITGPMHLLLHSPLLPGPSDPQWRTTIKESDGERGRVPLAVGGRGQWHLFTPLPSQGLSFSSVWMGALSLGHNTMRGPLPSLPFMSPSRAVVESGGRRRGQATNVTHKGGFN